MKKIYSLLIVSLILSCSGFKNAENKHASVKLYIFDSGQLVTEDISSLISEMKPERQILNTPTYLIVHPKGSLVWDAGLTDTLNQLAAGKPIYGGSWHASVSRTLKQQLNDLSIPPESIDYLTFSHFHSDHTGNASYFKNATLLLQENVYESAFSEEAQNYGFNRNDYLSLKQNVQTLKGRFDVFGDGSVVIIPMPGHALGHQVLFVQLPKTGPVLLSGDLYILNEQYKNQWVPVYNDKEKTLESYNKVKAILKETGATLWIQHDNDQFKTRRLSPKYYE